MGARRRCCCAEGCDIFEDYFNRANDSTLGSDWTEIGSSSWEIIDEQAYCNVAGIVLCDTATPTEAQVVTAVFKGVDTGNTYAVVLASTADGSSYHQAELTVLGAETVTDWTAPTDTASDIDGDNAWSNTNNIKTNNATYATVYADDDETSEYLIAFDFDFAIPTDAVIYGLEVHVQRKASASNSIKDLSVYLVGNSGTWSTYGNNQANSDWWSTSEEEITYGSSSSLWGLSSLASSSVNDQYFGVGVQVQGVAGGATASVDYIEMRIHYQDPEQPVGQFRLKKINSVLADGDAVLLNLPVFDPSYVTVTAWIDAKYFCAILGHIGGACTTLMADPEGLSGKYAGLKGSADTYFDTFDLEDHWTHDPTCEDCACYCQEDGVKTHMPSRLLLTITGVCTCYTASGDVELVLDPVACDPVYRDDPTTATGCADGNFTFELTCEITIVDGEVQLGTLTVTSADCNCATPCVLEIGGACDALLLATARGTDTNCPCCSGAPCGPGDPCWPTCQYSQGTLYFTITEIP